MKKLWQFLRASTTAILASLALLILTASLVGFTDLRGYIADQCSQLRVLYLFALALLLCPMLILRSRVGLCIAGMAVLINASQMLPYYLSADKVVQSNPERELKVVALNLWGRHNSDFDKVSDYLRQTDPDVLCLSEVNQTWLTRLRTDLPAYKYRFDEGMSGGAAIYSKIPIEQEIPSGYLGMRRYGVRGKCTVAGKEILIISAHPPAPYRPMTWKARNKEFERLADELGGSNSSTILIGDLNTTPWSKYFQRMLRQSNLKDSEVGNGIQPSWNAKVGLPPLVPIDHCLVSKDLVVMKRSVGPYVGSDHLPVCVRLQILDSKPTAGKS